MVLRQVLPAELDDHLDGEAAAGKPNRRNGYSKKTVLRESSKLELQIPRDREGTFDPKLIAKYQRRFPSFDEKIISMYTRGMSVREIQGHLLEIYGLDVSPDLISTVTDAVLETVSEWQNRPLETSYPLVFFDATDVAVHATERAIIHDRPAFGDDRRVLAQGSTSDPVERQINPVARSCGT